MFVTHICMCLRTTGGLVHDAGSSCEINIDECGDDPCLHGECLDGIANYTCNCEPGYDGTNCEYEIDECDVWKPCGEHGLCIGKWCVQGWP